MMTELTAEQERSIESFRAFVDREIGPYAERFDSEGAVFPEVLDRMAREGYFGARIDEAYGGRPMDEITFGLLCHELGRASASVLSIFTVHTIVTHTLSRWGTHEQRARYLPQLATGAMKGAFALSEPDVGSDARNVMTRAVIEGDGLIVSGCKKWTSAGAIADLFLVLTAADEGPTAVLIERSGAGLSTKRIGGAFAFRGALMAEVALEGCRVPTANVVGRAGFGFSHVTSTALDHGRYCIAWGAAGLTRACLDASARYANERQQFGVALGEHQLIRRKLADMYADASAARLLCQRAGDLREQGAAEAIVETSTAKYFASRAAVRAALEAVQIHGANGISADYPVARYLRDAKVLEIIEGSNEMQQLMIGEHVWRSFGR